MIGKIWPFRRVSAVDDDFGALTPASRREVLVRLSDALAHHYVLPQLADQMARHFKSQLRRGAYDQVESWAELASVLSAEMQRQTGDRHLRLAHRPGAVLGLDAPHIVIERRLRLPKIRWPWSKPSDRSPRIQVETVIEEESLVDPLDTCEAVREIGPEERMRQVEGEPEIELAVGSVPPARGLARRELLGDGVGYLEIHDLVPTARFKSDLADAMTFLAPSAAVILDLRENTGGAPEMVQLLASYFFAEPTLLNRFYDRPTDHTTEQWTLAEVRGPRFVDQPLFVLTSRRTFSAGEAFAYCLKHLGRAQIVGEPTGGGAHPSIDLPLGRGLVLLVPVARSMHPVTGTDWESEGVQPDLHVPADEALAAAHRAALARLGKTPTRTR